jgi:hypothetical protein
VAVAVVVMFLPVSASFADDPLLRLQGFGRQAGPAPTTAECGSALSNLGTPSGGGTLYEVARDRACHDVSQRRGAIAFAGGLLLVVLGFVGMVRVDHAPPAVDQGTAEPEPGPDEEEEGPELSPPAPGSEPVEPEAEAASAVPAEATP